MPPAFRQIHVDRFLVKKGNEFGAIEGRGVVGVEEIVEERVPAVIE